MLVLDNTNNPNIDYHAYFSLGSSSVVVLTSRNTECKQYTTTDFVALEGFPIDKVVELVLKVVGIAGV